MAVKVVSESVVTLSVTVGAASSGVVRATPVKLRKDIAIRNIAISSEEHNPDRTVTVQGGKHTLVDAMEDLQAYSSSPHTNPDNAPIVNQGQELNASVYVPSGSAPATNKKYVIAIAYWEVLIQP